MQVEIKSLQTDVPTALAVMEVIENISSELGLNFSSDVVIAVVQAWEKRRPDQAANALTTLSSVDGAGIESKTSAAVL